MYPLFVCLCMIDHVAFCSMMTTTTPTASQVLATSDTLNHNIPPLQRFMAMDISGSFIAIILLPIVIRYFSLNGIDQVFGRVSAERTITICLFVRMCGSSFFNNFSSIYACHSVLFIVRFHFKRQNIGIESTFAFDLISIDFLFLKHQFNHACASHNNFLDNVNISICCSDFLRITQGNFQELLY